MGTRLHIVVSEELVARVDEARGLVPRSAWLRAAVEQALGGQRKRGDAREAESPPAPAEQPEAWSQRPDYTMGARSSVQAKRDVRPVPKAGEK